MRGSLAVTCLVLLVGSFFPCSSLWAQGAPLLDQTLLQDNYSTPGVADNRASQSTATGEPHSPHGVIIPAGTKVLTVLRSPLHTTSATQESGIYLETLYAVVQGSQIVIPVHTQVQGEVEHDQRPGHVQRTAEFKFRFTSLIFPNNHVASINGVLQSVPGSKTARTESRDGTLHTVNQTEKVVVPMAIGALSVGLVGSVRSTGVGTYVGAGLGAGLGLGGVLLTRGDEINLPRGTNIEMVLQSPLVLEPEQAAFNAQYVPTAAAAGETKDPHPDGEEDQRENPRKARSRRSLHRIPFPGLP